MEGAAETGIVVAGLGEDGNGYLEQVAVEMQPWKPEDIRIG